MAKYPMAHLHFHRLPLALLCAFTFAAHAQSPPLPPPADQQLAHDIFKQFIEIKSGYTTGSTTPVAEAAAARLRAAGFPEPDIFLGGPIPTKHNLVARLHGTGAHRPILLLAHEDVVEARREDWSPGLDPYVFTEKDGYFYGRGTSDDKDQAAVWIATLIRMKREGFVPDRDIIVALTADEEGGGPYSGIQWLLKNHRDLIDAELALNEGGYGELSHGQKIANDVQVAEKYMVSFRFEVHNKGGHSSLPVPDNAIYHLAGALTRLADFGFPLKTNAANINCRVLPEDSVEYVQQSLTRVAADPQVAISILNEVHKAPGSPLNPQLLAAITAATGQEWPNVPVVPIMVPYATDGAYTRAAGIPTYGIQGFFMDRDDIRFHGRDERLLVISFYEGHQFLYTLVKSL